MHNRLLCGWIGIWLCIAGLIGIFRDEPKSRPAPAYYDIRERISATMTFEWNNIGYLQLRQYLVDSINETNRLMAEKYGTEHKPIDPSIVNQIIELNNYYVIERTPNVLRLKVIKEIPSITDGSKSLEIKDIYYKDNHFIFVHYDRQGQVSSVDIAQSEEKDALTLEFESAAGYEAPGLRIFLAGVSPLRYKGVSLDQWRLVSLSPEQWVFELITQSDEEPKITVTLDRRYQDCPAKMEIKYPSTNRVYVWRTLKYKRVDGVWFPSEVEFTLDTPLQILYTKYVLVKTTQTKEIKIDIPEGTPVRDWRKSGLKAWQFSSEDNAYEETTWSSTILQGNQGSSPKR